MATQLSSLKMSNVIRTNKANTNEFRRNKLIKKLDEQINLATAERNGELYAVKRLKSVKDEVTGAVTQIEVSKRVSPWFWTDNSKTLLQLRYGTKVLDLQKGKNTIECSDQDELVKTLLLVKNCVFGGELDAVIEAASLKVKERFGK